MVNHSEGQTQFPAESSKLIKSDRYSSALLRFVRHFRGAAGLYLVAALIQVSCGMALVTVTLLDLIQPMWVSTLLNMLGSMATMLGLYIFYEILHRRQKIDNLIKDAIQRVMISQN